jgi:hypothetical protein
MNAFCALAVQALVRLIGGTQISTWDQQLFFKPTGKLIEQISSFVYLVLSF